MTDRSSALRNGMVTPPIKVGDRLDWLPYGHPDFTTYRVTEMGIVVTKIVAPDPNDPAGDSVETTDDLCSDDDHRRVIVCTRDRRGTEFWNDLARILEACWRSDAQALNHKENP